MAVGFEGAKVSMNSIVRGLVVARAIFVGENGSGCKFG